MIPPAMDRFGLFNTASHRLASTYIDQSFQVGVWLPFSYWDSDRHYPVLYVPDGEFGFGLAAGLVPTLIGTGDIPEIIVVGIAYDGITTWGEQAQLRERNLVPPGAHDRPETSRCEQFSSFLREELLPFIERTYRADPRDRVLFGFSAAGLFALHSMLSQPSMFRRYVAASCTWPGADSYLLQCARDYVVEREGMRLSMSIGSAEGELLPGFLALSKAFSRMQGLGFDRHVVEGSSMARACWPALLLLG